VGEALALQANLLMVETVVGTGKEVKEGDHVTVHIVGTLKDGTVFDDSRKRKKPLQFVAGGDGAVVKGLSEGVIGMKVGGHRALTVPPALGYGNKKGAKAPPGSTLQFDVELLSVK
jgi:FKBP-type peptidyl-prolyl cis-trans isomerase